jgi:hypothetical protein
MNLHEQWRTCSLAFSLAFYCGELWPSFFIQDLLNGALPSERKRSESLIICECCEEENPSVRDRNLTYANAAKIVSVSICDDCEEKIHKPALRDDQFRAWAKRKEYCG